MAKERYVVKRFHADTLALIAIADMIIEDYQGQGLSLTLRQLYYRFVAKGVIPNEQRAYKRLGDALNNARLAGLIDWSAIEDRGRGASIPFHWDNPGQIIETMANAYKIDRWAGQPVYLEVWVEKQALEAVVEQACEPLDVAYLACKGYLSQSEMYAAAERFKQAARQRHNYECVVLHLGDHDPSGLDMTRDIRDRLNQTFGAVVDVKRLALNMDQIQEHDPPPNPAKMTDSRAHDYCAAYGEHSWELDALEPQVLNDLIQGAVLQYLEQDLYDARLAKEREEREALARLADNWEAQL